MCIRADLQKAQLRAGQPCAKITQSARVLTVWVQEVYMPSESVNALYELYGQP